MDTLFVQEGTPCGFGYIDVMRDAQMYIDKLSQVVLEHTVMMSRKRYFIRQNSAVNEAEFADLKNRFVHVAGNLGDEDIREIKAEPLDNSVMNALSLKIDELKETSGNRDFSQGSVSNGDYGGKRHCGFTGGRKQAVEGYDKGNVFCVSAGVLSYNRTDKAVL